MLCLGISHHENVIIELPDKSTMVIRVVEIERGRVRLGFLASDDVRIYREKVCPTAVLEAAGDAGQLIVSRTVRCSVCSDPKCDNPNGKH
jgi:sRNA-binding carbon storage regulator CsrA